MILTSNTGSKKSVYPHFYTFPDLYLIIQFGVFTSNKNGLFGK